jgi:hypothetical protein
MESFSIDFGMEIDRRDTIPPFSHCSCATKELRESGADHTRSIRRNYLPCVGNVRRKVQDGVTLTVAVKGAEDGKADALWKESPRE